MARLKSATRLKPTLLRHFQAVSADHISRFSTESGTELAPAEYLYPRRHAERLDAIEERRPFIVGAWELPPGTEIPAWANNYIVQPDGTLSAWEEGDL